MKSRITTYLYIIPDSTTGRVYMGHITHGNPDLEAVKDDIRFDLHDTDCDVSNIILMDVTDRKAISPDLVLMLDGECDAIQMVKYNTKNRKYVMPITPVKVEWEDDNLWLKRGDNLDDKEG